MAPGTTSTSGSDDLLALDGVTVVLSGREVLRDVCFDVRPGELTALIGSNGAGKTTLFRVILGLQATAAGQVHIDGTRRAGRGGSVGYVPQKVAIDPDIPLRARDLVGLGLDGHRFGVPLPSRRRRDLVHEMLAAVDAESFEDARVGTLSGGELQRVLIAHALISRPRLLLLDEPLANLDLRSEQEVVQVLAGVTREQNVAVLVSAHDMNPLLPVMDRVVYLAGGRVASGPIEEVVRSEVLSELYGSPVTVLHVGGRILVVAEPIPDEVSTGRRPFTVSNRRPQARRRPGGKPWGSDSSPCRWPVTSFARALFEPGFFSSAPVHAALIAGGVVSLLSASVGVFTVMRGQSFAGHAFGDIGTTGGSAGFLVGVSPLWGFVGVGMAAAVTMELFGVQRARDATWPPASCSEPPSASRRSFSTGTRRSGARPARRSRSSSVRSSP